MNFKNLYASAQRLGISLCPHRAKKLYEAALTALELDGEFWECGVYQGGSAEMLLSIVTAKFRPFRLFDTFTGFTGITDADKPKGWNHMREGNMAASLDSVRARLGSTPTFYPGAIPKTFKGLEGSRIAFANIDVDLYQPTRDALAFILPRMVPGGTIIIDDCGAEEWPGVEKAVREIAGDNYSKSRCSCVGWKPMWQGRIDV